LRSELALCHCFWRQGGEGTGTDQESDQGPRLERTLPKFTPTKEDSHGNEEEEKEEDAEIVREGAGLVLGPRKTLRFCGVCDPAKRLNTVRPLLLSEHRNLFDQR
jgi:hypothetical protein